MQNLLRISISISILKIQTKLFKPPLSPWPASALLSQHHRPLAFPLAAQPSQPSHARSPPSCSTDTWALALPVKLYGENVVYLPVCQLACPLARCAVCSRRVRQNLHLEPLTLSYHCNLVTAQEWAFTRARDLTTELPCRHVHLATSPRYLSLSQVRHSTRHLSPSPDALPQPLALPWTPRFILSSSHPEPAMAAPVLPSIVEKKNVALTCGSM